MRIIFFLINMNLGGTEKSFLNLVDALPKDYEIDLLLLEEKGELFKYLPKNVNLKIIENPTEINEFIRIGCRRYAFKQLNKGKFFYFLKNILVFLLFKLKLIKHTFYGISNLVKKQSGTYDYAVAWAGPHDFISYYTLNFINSKRKLQWLHFDVILIAFNKQISKSLYNKFDEIKLVSKTARDNFVNLFPEFNQKTTVFKNIVNIEQIRKLAVVPDAGFNDSFEGFRILTVGRLTNQKGYDLALPAVAKLINDGFNVRYYIIGDGPNEQKLREQISNLKMESHILLLGSKENPYPYMAQTDIYLQPSRHEGQGMTIVEAKVFCKPVILSNFTVAKDSITDGINGLITGMDSDSIYKGLKRVLENNKLKTFLIENLKNENDYENEKELPF